MDIKECERPRTMRAFILSGIINTLLIYIAISLYNYYFHGWSFFSLSSLFLSILIVLINYFAGSKHYTLYDKLKGNKL